MQTNKQIETGAKALAADVALPGGGRKKLARLVGDHLHWFEVAEARGMTWADMSRLLFAAGVHGANGRPIPVGTLSSTVWRKRQDASPSSPSVSVKDHRQSRLSKTERARLEPPTPRKQGSTAVRAKAATKMTPSTSPGVKSRLTKAPVKDQAAANQQALAFMRRAAELRRGRTD